MKENIVSVHKARAPHMVGDGLPVRNVFSCTDLGKRELSSCTLYWSHSNCSKPCPIPVSTIQLGEEFAKTLR